MKIVPKLTEKTYFGPMRPNIDICDTYLMRVLLINNGEGFSSLLEQYFQSHDVTSIHWDGICDINTVNFDLAVLSGSSGFPIMGHEYELQDEMNFIRSGSIPILGICYGFELIVVSFGGTLKKMEQKERGVVEMDILRSDPILEGIHNLFVYEGHRWVADSIPEELIPLAKSEHGIEGVKHKSHLLYGLQFHPEKLLRETEGKKVLDNFIKIAR